MSAPDALEAYAADCSKVAVGYIERATRFGATDLHIRETTPATRRVRVTVRVELEVCSESDDLHGVHEPDPDDLSLVDGAAYQQAVAAQAQAEVARVATIRDVAKVIQDGPYGAVRARTCVRVHPRRLFHPYRCQGCGGGGRITCAGCNGGGMVTCFACGGRGRFACAGCGGSGTRTEQYQVQVPHSTQVDTVRRTVSCSQCGGAREFTCQSCGGLRTVKCGRCRGDGRVTCGQCSGHGSLTRITTTRTYARQAFIASYPTGTPDYVHPALSRVGLPNLGEVGQVTLVDNRIMEEEQSAESAYDVAIPFCELALDIGGHRSTGILYGTAPRIFDAGGIVSVLVQADSDALGALLRGTRPLTPWFPRLAQEAVDPFMRSEIHQQILGADAEGGTPAAIADHLNRAVSESYVAESLRRLRWAVQVALIWWRIRWASGLAAFSIVAVVLVEAVFDRGTVFTVPAGTTWMWLLPAEDALAGCLVSIPVAVLGWLAARWTSRRWLRKVGGASLVDWATRKKLVFGWGTALAVVVAGVLAVTAFYRTFPLWVDTHGRAYGVLPIVSPLRVLPPDPRALPPSTGREARPNPRDVRGGQ